MPQGCTPRGVEIDSEKDSKPTGVQSGSFQAVQEALNLSTLPLPTTRG